MLREKQGPWTQSMEAQKRLRLRWRRRRYCKGRASIIHFMFSNSIAAEHSLSLSPSPNSAHCRNSSSHVCAWVRLYCGRSKILVFRRDKKVRQEHQNKSASTLYFDGWWNDWYFGQANSYWFVKNWNVHNLPFARYKSKLGSITLISHCTNHQDVCRQRS